MYPYSSLECSELNSSTPSFDRVEPNIFTLSAAAASVRPSQAASQIEDDSFRAATRSALAVLDAAPTDFFSAAAIEQIDACASATCATISPKLRISDVGLKA